MKDLIFHGWIIVLSGVVLCILTYGIRSSFPIFYIHILDEFGWSRASTALIYSISLLSFGIAAPFTGALIDRFGAQRIILIGVLIEVAGAVGCAFASAVWQFYILFGVLVAIGICVSGWVPFSVILSRWFIRRRGTALGIYMASGALSYLITFVAEFLITGLGWRVSFGVLGALPLLVVLPIVALVLRSRPEDLGLVADGAHVGGPAAQDSPRPPAEALVVDSAWASRDWTLPRALKTARFWLLWGTFFCWTGVGFNIVTAHQAAFAVDMGYSEVLAASVFVFFAIAGTLGYFLGFISDRIGREQTFVLGSLSALAGVGLLLLVRDDSSPWLLYGYGVLVGWGWGVIMPAITATTVDLFQGRHVGAIVGSAMSGFGVGGMVGPWLAGLIHDRSGSYDIAFVLVEALFLAAMVFILLAAPGKVRRVPGKAGHQIQPAGPRQN